MVRRQEVCNKKKKERGEGRWNGNASFKMEDPNE